MSIHSNWLVSRTNPEFLEHLAGRMSISPVIAQVLVNRGMKDNDAIQEFLYPSLDDLHDPFLMPDMDRAVERLKAAMEKDETVLIHGDYDAAGITSVALLVDTLKKYGLKTHYHIPNRIREGYGLSDKGIEKAGAVGAALIITADCGITSADEVAKARSMGIDVIVTDHHEPPEKLPDAAAVVDPHRADSLYPFKYLAGVGVVYKLIQALVQDTGRDDIHPEDLLDLAALGTIADSVPLLGENRIIVSQGLQMINDSLCRTGVNALKESAGVNGGSRAGSLSYSLIPRINAAGRLDDAGEVVELFLSHDKAKAKGIAGLLEEQNRKRQRIERDVLKQALDMIDPDRLEGAIVLSSPDWHPGVIGIVASRLVDRFYRPVFLFSEKDSVAKGSARGIPPFHLYNAIAECEDLLIGFGGHRQAAGLSISTDNLPAFQERINTIVARSLSAEDMVPVLEIDAAVNFTELNFNLVKELSILEPFGNANRQPVFGARDTSIVNWRIVGNNHLKMQLRQSGLNMETIGFSMGRQMKDMSSAPSLDIAFVPSINEWNGVRNLQLTLKAVRPGS